MKSFFTFMSHGGYSMWLIAAASLTAVAISLERWLATRLTSVRRSELARDVFVLLDKRELDAAKTLTSRSSVDLGAVFHAGLTADTSWPWEHVASTTHRERLRVIASEKRGLWLLGSLGAIAPFVGLFGTVVGIMDAMNKLKGEVTLADVSGPISSALIVTAAGILVAVAAVMLFNYLSQRFARSATDARLLTDEFLERLHRSRTGAQ